MSVSMSTPTPGLLALPPAPLPVGAGPARRVLLHDDQHAAILGAYPRHALAEMFALVFGGTADEYAESTGRIVALETKLAAARGMWCLKRDADLNYNLRTFAELSEQASLGFDWDQWAGALGLPRPRSPNWWYASRTTSTPSPDCGAVPTSPTGRTGCAGG